MAKDILKEAIADAKAVREVALANAKAALEEAFTPKLQSMLSAKLSEELNESDEEIEENVNEEETIDEVEDIDEVVEMEESENLDEEIDLEEILNELELEEGDDSEENTIDEVKDEDEEETLEELDSPTPTASEVHNVLDSADHVNEDEEFDLDTLLEEINNLDENEDEMDESFAGKGGTPGARGGLGSKSGGLVPLEGESFEDYQQRVPSSPWIKWFKADSARIKANFSEGASVYEELEETQSALETVRTELNEVNLLNSKLLYVNRIFKANTLDDAQKLRVVETLDKAECIKEAKLIYETIKDTFTISKGKKTTPKRSIREGLGMASKAAGTSTAKKAVLNESNDMVARMQKLANITINQ